jgi:uncharacterized damage-inducible protein DinB
VTSGSIAVAREQITFARAYTRRLLDHTPAELWFRQPAEGVTHIAWQVGHLAMAQYRLVLERTRGQRPGDAELISDDFLARFGRDSVPDPSAARYPAVADLRGVFDRVHEQVLRELGELREEELDAPPVKPHSLCATKRACLFWCAQHEMVHTGQIGLLRRLLGQAPLW